MIFLLLYAQLTAHGCYIVAATLSKIHVLCGVGSVQFSPSLLQRHGITPLSQTAPLTGTQPFLMSVSRLCLVMSLFLFPGKSLRVP